ncbi:MAG: MBL fold metallo-hydrolase [Candidatus Nitrosocosmicus sp.]|jgi:glyoxylase-like metal-dependent hydrolase (beta-lactamase superfamily II)|uniref:MBL fold metallo-hydrolase n=1 Tax=Candidatus Nitrosocosmicus agrestis TaxID=2563600 RepID=UPI00122DD18B|nr:MBL fold metallo-hydrolase [Candidatus Nitrosocosmicus sp. SS]KAA2281546.1 MBL fold metallo-hydrolase [Candidatus Nitrosocosmicus sp. SS]KAF0869749.1 MBL fold metallo-hydrolase [Candidatus Nitrosocosmicus sp. SS]
MTEITKNVYSIEGMTHPDPRGKVFPYLFVEDKDNLTLIDPGFLSQLPMLEKYLQDVGYEIKNVKQIILTHVHVDHAQAANEIKRRSGARIYSHWIEARYLAHNPPYMGPPSTQETIKKLENLGISVESLSKEYGTLEVEPISVDEQVSDGDMIGSLKVIHTPGHTPGHISLYYEKDKLLLGADSIYKKVFGAEGLYISAPQVSMDPTTAIVSVQRLSRINFDKLLMAHQDSPLLEGAREAVEKLVAEYIQNLKG